MNEREIEQSAETLLYLKNLMKETNIENISFNSEFIEWTVELQAVQFVEEVSPEKLGGSLQTNKPLLVQLNVNVLGR